MLIVTLRPHLGTEIVILISNPSFPSLHHTRHLLGGGKLAKTDRSNQPLWLCLSWQNKYISPQSKCQYLPYKRISPYKSPDICLGFVSKIASYLLMLCTQRRVRGLRRGRLRRLPLGSYRRLRLFLPLLPRLPPWLSCGSR